MDQSRSTRNQISVQRQPLLLPHDDSSSDEKHSNVKYNYQLLQLSKCMKTCCFPARHSCCLPSKAAVLILLWTALVGAVYEQLRGITIASVNDANANKPNYSSSSYALLALIMVFYPLCGFIADVYCGRIKCVSFSLWMLLLALLLSSIAIMLVFLTDKHVGILSPLHHGSYHKNPVFIIVVIFAAFSFPMFLIGIAGYQANYIQLGLEQLLEARSVHLGMFVHWANWSYHALATVVILLYSVALCYARQYQFAMDSLSLYFPPIVHLLAFFIVLCLSCYKRRWFDPELRRRNPYKTVLKVLNYARKNKIPRRRSAFTFADQHMPSRMDFAKERFGGPFTSEEVEDVKTFLRILLILLTLIPIHFLHVPASFFVFSLLGQHVGPRTTISTTHFNHCSAEWFTLQSGSMIGVVSTFCFPIYIWFIFSYLQNRLPRIFTRLKLGIVVFLLGVFSMLIVDITGHAISPSITVNGTVVTHFSCVFHGNYTSSVNKRSLNVHWALLIPPNLLLGIGPLIFETTSLEFISAQSPYFMKGLLVGVYFALKGLSQFISSVIMVPISLKHVTWDPSHVVLNKIPPIISCGFMYLLIACVMGLIGLIMFSIAAMKYRYRDRGDQMYIQRDIEEVYDRFLAQNDQNQA